MLRQAHNSPKLKRLKRRLQIPHYAAVGILESLWHMASTQAQRGDIGKWSDEDIAAQLEWEGDETTLIEALVGCGWLDEHPEHRLVVHDWHAHADTTVRRSPQVRDHGFVTFEAGSGSKDDNSHASHESVACASQVNDLRFTRQPEPEPEPEPEPASARARQADLEADFSEWYGRYPNKVGKGAAVRAYQGARRKADQATLLDGLDRYIAGKPPDRPWCNPATWLNQDRWLDQPAATGGAEAAAPAKDWSLPENRRECIEFYVEHIDDEATRWDPKWGDPPTEAEIAACRAEGSGAEMESVDDLLKIPPFLDRREPTT